MILSSFGNRTLNTMIILTAVILLGLPTQAMALQPHGGPEGLYIHQGAHIIFMIAMISFAMRIYRSPLINKKAWRLMSFGAWLLALWNLWAFSGHILEEIISDSHLIKLSGDDTPYLQITSWKEVLYYFLKMDHLICLPAVFFFYLGIKAMSSEFLDRSKINRD